MPQVTISTTTVAKKGTVLFEERKKNSQIQTQSANIINCGIAQPHKFDLHASCKS